MEVMVPTIVHEQRIMVLKINTKKIKASILVNTF